MLNFKSTTNNLNPKSKSLNVRTYDFSLSIIRFTSELPNNRTFWTIGDQLLRAGTSIGANITEAKSSSSRREFIKFYQIALKSANEVKYWLGLLKDSGLIKGNSIEFLIIECDEINRMLASSLLTLKGKR